MLGTSKSTLIVRLLLMSADDCVRRVKELTLSFSCKEGRGYSSWANIEQQTFMIRVNFHKNFYVQSSRRQDEKKF